MTKVSVVIPTYDRPQFLEGAVSSALSQDVDGVEVVVVDDGSPTNYAADVLDSFSESIRLVTHEENKGLSAARNSGIDAATGDYVAFLDDDDRWAASKLRRQVAALEANPDAGLATCLLAAVTLDGDLLRCEGGMPEGDLSREILLSNAIGTPSRVLIRASVLDEVGVFDEELSTKQDWDLYIRVCQDWEVVCVDDHLCFRAIHDNMSNDPGVMRTDLRAVIDKHESLFSRRGLYDHALASYFETVGFWYLEDDQIEEGRDHLSRSLSYEFRFRPFLLYISTFLGEPGSDLLVTLKRRLNRRCNCSSVEVPATLFKN